MGFKVEQHGAMPDNGAGRATIFQHAALLFAVCLSPVALRLALLVERGIGFSVIDMRGVLSDLTVSLFIFIAVSFLFRWKWWPGVLLVSVWSIANYGNYEHIKTLEANARMAEAGYLFDWTFLRGSALTASRPLLLAGVVCGAAVASGFALSGKKAAGFRVLAVLVSAVAALGIHNIWRQDYEALSWRQANFVYENVQRAAASLVPGSRAGLPGDGTPELERFLRADLEGTPVLRLGNSGENVLLVMLESVSGAYLDSVSGAHGVRSPIRMPNLDRLARQNVVFRSFVSHQRVTSRGEYAILCGDYPRLVSGETRMNEIVQLHEEVTCLPGVLRDAGYETVYLQAAPLGFMLKEPFMSGIGFSGVYGNKWFKDAYERNTWGVDDRAYFEQSLDMVRRLQAGRKPWFMTMLTVGTHDPYNVPKDYSSPYKKGSLGHAMAYLDEALGEFLGALEDEGVLDNTLVLITTDESVGISQGNDDLTKKLSQNWGVLVAISPGKERMDIGETFGQVDLAVSILDYLGLKGQAWRFSGRSVFRKYDSGRPVFFANRGMIGAVDASDNLYLCWDDFDACSKYSLEGNGLFSPARVKRDMAMDEVAFLSGMAGRGRGKPENKRRAFPLMVAQTVPLLSDERQDIFGDQHLKVSAGTRIEVDLEIEVLGEDGQMVFTSTLLSNEGKKTIPHFIGQTLPLGPGETFRLRHFYDARRDLKGLQYRVSGLRLWGPPMELEIKKARMALGEANTDGSELVEGLGEIDYTVDGVDHSSGELSAKKIKLYTAALEHRPDSALLHLSLGNTYRRLGLTGKAMGHFRTVLRLKPDNVPVHKIMAGLYYKQGAIGKAIEHYEAVLILDPHDSDVHYNLGAFYWKKGLSDKAVEHYETFIKSTPASYKARNNLASIYLSKGMTDKALEQLQLALALKPDSARIHFNISRAYRKKGQIEKAEEHARMAESLNRR